MTIDPLTGDMIITQADYDEHNLQGLIELSYVRTANEVLVSNMASLESALQTTKNVMDTLTGLQTLHNRIQVSGKGSFSAGFNYSTGTVQGYKDAAKAFFGASVNPSFAIAQNTPEANQFTNDLVALKAKLSAQIPLLSAITPKLPLDQGGGEDPNSLLAKLRAVLNDLNTNNITTYAGQKAWVEDNYSALTGSASTSAGQIQQRLTFAITAGQSLNDTQKETVRRYLFLFEEYYKSASAVLQKISQIIEKMAQNTAR